MSITILSYMDNPLAEQVNAFAFARALAARAKEREEQARQAAEAQSDFSSVLSDAVSQSAATGSSSAASGATSTACPSDLYKIFEEAANAYGVPVKLLVAMARAESGFNASAVSKSGAIGIMQLMPETARALGVSNPYDARENIMGGARYISQLLQKYGGNVSYALAAYNAGSNAVDQYGGVPPFAETQAYVQKILSYLDAELTIEEPEAAQGEAADAPEQQDAGSAAEDGKSSPISELVQAAAAFALSSLSEDAKPDADRLLDAIEDYRDEDGE